MHQFFEQVAFDGDHDGADEGIGRKYDFHGQVGGWQLNGWQKTDVSPSGLGIVKSEGEGTGRFSATASSEY